MTLRLISGLRNFNTELGSYNHFVTMALQKIIKKKKIFKNLY